MRTLQLRRLVGLAAGAALALTGCDSETPGASGDGRGPGSGNGPEERASAAARRFLDEYLEADGRVVRRDEAGDTVSEGQAYAMLLAVAVGEREPFDRAWGWASSNLQRPDGLLSWHWRSGGVADPQPAADADIDAARALVLAAERFGDEAYRAEARRIAASILANESLPSANGPVVAAGPWAVRAARHYLNPSYFSPRAFASPRRASDDAAWERAAEAGYTILENLLDGDAVLPPDWAVLDGGGEVRPGGRGPQYGLDAVRVPARMAEDCDRRGRAIAARVWAFLRTRYDEAGMVAAYGLDGRPVTGEAHPAALVGAAGAAKAAGDDGAVWALLDGAEALEREQPGYYGAAWVALGRVTLTTDLLGSC
jgi:endoglucanase